MLRERLRADRLLFMDRSFVRHALAYPWCWPHDPALHEHACRHAEGPPAAPKPGEVLLVAVEPTGCRRSLYRLSPGRHREACPLTGSARQSLDLVHQVVTRHLPYLGKGSLPRPDDWSAILVGKEGSGVDRSLDGESFGLSIFLAVASRVLGLPIPAQVAASAVIDYEGRLRKVDGIADKVAVLQNLALGVRRFFVAEEQADEARAAVAKAPSDLELEIVPVASASSALELALGDIRAALLRRWDDQACLDRELDVLFSLALSPPKEGILDWQGVERMANLFLERIPPGDPRRFEAAFAHAVARRHRGLGGEIPLPSPEEQASLGNRRKQRLYLAHRLQEAADTLVPDSDRRIEDALQQLSTVESLHDATDEDLKASGAIGRALSALRRYDEAAFRLRETVDAWRAVGRFADASYALCEWLRTSALLDDRSQLDEAIEVARAYREEPGVDPTSESFVRFACGRALALVGDHEAALEWLREAVERWRFVPVHLRLSRLRWLAIVHRALGNSAAREQAEAELRRTPESIQVLLSDLDAALVAGAPVEPILERLRRHASASLRRFFVDELPPLETAQRIVREYPY